MDRTTLFALLACPACRERLASGDEGLSCRRCGTLYPVVAGVPDFVSREERSRIRSLRETWGGERVTNDGNRGLLARLRPFLPRPAPFLNLVSAPNLGRLDRMLAPRPHALLLDLGSGDGCGAGIEALARDLREQRTVRLDVDAFPGVEVVALGPRLPFADGTFAAVLLKAVLEHVEDPELVLAEALRVLEPEGMLYLEVPFLFEYHPNPGDYVRYTRAGLERALGAWEALEVGTLIGPFAALASLQAHALALLLSFRSRLLRKGLLPLLTWVTWPLSLGDYLVVAHPSAHFVAHHLYAFARKPAGPASPAGRMGA